MQKEYKITYKGNLVEIEELADLNVGKADIEVIKKFIKDHIAKRIDVYRQYVSSFDVEFIDDDSFQDELNALLESR